MNVQGGKNAVPPVQGRAAETRAGGIAGEEAVKQPIPAAGASGAKASAAGASTARAQSKKQEENSSLVVFTVLYYYREINIHWKQVTFNADLTSRKIKELPPLQT